MQAAVDRWRDSYCALRNAVLDPHVTAIAMALADKHGVVRRDHIEREEIVAPAVSADQRGTEDPGRGHCHRPGDIEVVWGRRLWLTGLPRRSDVEGQ